jgi:hypothetical protein
VPRVDAAVEGPVLLFFGGVGESLLLSGVSKETGDEPVGKLAEGLVNEGLQDSQSRGIASELLGPLGLLGSKLGVNLLQSLIRRGDVGAALGVESETHGKSFPGNFFLLG